MELDFSASACAVGRDPASGANKFRSRRSRIGFIVMALCLIVPTVVGAQKAPGEPPVGTEAQWCAALAELNLEDAPGGPALVTSARIVEVPATGLERWILTPSGYGSS